MIDKDYVIRLLAQNVPTAQIAAAVGCEPSYISQLKQDESIQTAIAAQQSEATLEDIKFDDMLARAEQLALERIEKTLPFANMMQSLAAFKILNAAKKRNEVVNTPQSVTNNLTVNLTLPSQAIPKFTVNAKNEIIEVEGQTMISATPRSLDQILTKRLGVPESQTPVTALNRAATRLGALSQPLPREPRKLPTSSKIDISDIV